MMTTKRSPLDAQHLADSLRCKFSAIQRIRREHFTVVTAMTDDIAARRRLVGSEEDFAICLRGFGLEVDEIDTLGVQRASIPCAIAP